MTYPTPLRVPGSLALALCLVAAALTGCSDSSTSDLGFTDTAGIDPDSGVSTGGEGGLDADETGGDDPADAADDPGPDQDDTGGDEPDADDTGSDEPDVDDTGDEPDVDDTGDLMDVDDTGDEPDVDDTGDEPDVDDTGDEPDVVEPDPCHPNPCTNPPASTCDGDSVVSWGEFGECSDVEGEPSCTYTETVTPCGEGMTCVPGAECAEVTPDVPPSFAAAASYVTKLVLVGDEPECFDYDGDGDGDGSFGEVVATTATLLPPVDGGVNGVIAKAIEEGGISLVFEVTDFDGFEADDGISVNAYSAYSEDDYATRTAGESQFHVEPKSFWPDTYVPMNHLDHGSVDTGTLTATDGAFAFWLPLVTGFPVFIDHGQLAAAIETGANGAGLDMTDGVLGGTVQLAQVADIANALLGGCECFGLSEGASVLEVASEDALACSAEFASADVSGCLGETGLCNDLASAQFLLCGAIGLIQPDIDTDDNGKADSFSMCMTYEGASATIDGVGTDQPSYQPSCSGAGGGAPFGLLAALVIGLLAVRRRRAAALPR